MSIIIRRQPARTRSEFERFFDDLWTAANAENEVRSHAYALPLDVIENDESFIVTASLPGVNPDQIEIRLHDDLLSISAEVPQQNLPENSKKVLNERRYGKFNRSLRLSVPVQVDAIEANYEHGILTLRVPKAQPRTIPVRAANGN